MYVISGMVERAPSSVASVIKLYSSCEMSITSTSSNVDADEVDGSNTGHSPAGNSLIAVSRIAAVDNDSVSANIVLVDLDTVRSDKGSLDTGILEEMRGNSSDAGIPNVYC